jgi:hypothetical protein
MKVRPSNHEDEMVMVLQLYSAQSQKWIMKHVVHRQGPEKFNLVVVTIILKEPQHHIHVSETAHFFIQLPVEKALEIQHGIISFITSDFTSFLPFCYPFHTSVLFPPIPIRTVKLHLHPPDDIVSNRQIPSV